jgi:hypothetical protein
VSWAVNDLVSDADLRDYEADILSNFGETTWQAKLTKALEDWLFPILKGRGFDPFRLVTRAEVAQAFGYTASAYTDLTAATRDETADDVNLATIFASPSGDALYLGSKQPFRGLFVRELDTPSSAAGEMSVAYWNGAWSSLTIGDETKKVAGKTFSGGGSVKWILPVDWQTRKVSASEALYWVKVTVSAVPTGAKTGQIGVIRASCLRAPATFRTLQLIFQEAPTGQEGPWREKAEFYKDEAASALERALTICGSEFDSDQSELISETEEGQTTEQVSGGWSFERA